MSGAWLQILSDYCNFGTLKGERLLIIILISNNCFSHKSFFQNCVDALSKIIDAICQKLFFLLHFYYSYNLKHYTERIRYIADLKTMHSG